MNELSEAIQNMKRWHPIYKVLRDGLTAKGYWKKHARGDPKKGWQVRKSKIKDKVNAL